MALEDLEFSHLVDRHNRASDYFDIKFADASPADKETAINTFIEIFIRMSQLWTKLTEQQKHKYLEKLKTEGRNIA